VTKGFSTAEAAHPVHKGTTLNRINSDHNEGTTVDADLVRQNTVERF
jgi:hypothetical protein